MQPLALTVGTRSVSHVAMLLPLPWLDDAPLTMLLAERRLGLDADAFARASLDRAGRAGRCR